MFLRRIKTFFKDGHWDLDRNQIGWERSRTIFEFAFGLIEAGVILGALSAAWDFSHSGVVLCVWFCGYFSVAIYLKMSLQYASAILADRFELPERYSWFPAASWALNFGLGFAVPYLVSALASNAIVAALR